MYPGTPCDENGFDLPRGYPPPPPPPPPVDENGVPQLYYPYKNCEEFELAYFLFKRSQMPGSEIDELMQIWGKTLPPGTDPPFADHGDLYKTIDATTLGDVPWQSFSVSYSGELPKNGNIPPWMLAEYDVWYRDPKAVLEAQLNNPDFKDDIDYAPFQKYNTNGEREWKDFMSANWSYQQAVRTIFHLRFLFDEISDKIIGHHRRGPPNSWRTVCPGYFGER